MIKVKLKEAKAPKSSIWDMVPIGRAKTLNPKTGKLTYRNHFAIIHIPSGMKIPTDYYKSTEKEVKALIQFLDSQSWPDINSPAPSMETIESIHDIIIDSEEFSRPSMKYTKVSLNEALTGLMLPDILNTKVMESVSLSGMAQETFGRFVRDWMLNWGSNVMSQVTKAITMNLDETRRLMKHIFFRLYENNGGNKKHLSASENYYVFTHETWKQRLRDINLTGMMDKKLAEWRRDLVRSLEPGKGNDIDPQILDKTLDDFIQMKKFLQEQGSKFYRISQGDPDESIDGKGKNYSHMWAPMRKVMKSVRKYLEKRDIPGLFQWIEHIHDETLLANFNIMFRARDVVRLRKFLNKEEKNWVDIDKLLKDPGQHRDSRDAINTFIEKKEHEDKYREAFNTMCSDIDGGFAPKGKPCIIKKYDDGWFWFSRGTNKCDSFAKDLKNCGLGKKSLIDLKKIVKRGDSQRDFSRIGIDYDVAKKTINQILGGSNEFPPEKYWPYIEDFIFTYGVQDIEKGAFEYLKDQDDEEIFNFVMSVGNDAVKKKWIERKEEKKSSTDAIVDDIMTRTITEAQKTWKRNLNYQPPKEIDAKKAHAVQSWYKNKRNKIK